MNDLKLRLKPHWNEGTVDYMWLYYEYPAEELTTSPEIDYGDKGFGGLCPFPEYDHFSLTDDKLIIPDPDAFDGKFEFYEHEVEKDGITMTSYRCRAK